MITVKSNKPPMLFVDGLYTFDNPEFISDSYHTFDELYDHRRELSRIMLTLLDELYQSGQSKFRVWKSKLHSDGTMFDGYFVVGCETPYGQISYHYDFKYWDHFDLTEYDNAPEYDGHTSQNVIERLAAWKSRSE